jgi:hypothetical protein
MAAIFYKILRKDLIHRGFKYKLGLNIDTVSFNASEPCSPGGLHFCTLEKLPSHVNYGEFVGEIELPFANNLSEYHLPLRHYTREMCEKAVHEIAVRHRPSLLPHVPRRYRTSEMCHSAMSADPSFFRYVPYKLKTLDMCKNAIIYCPWNLPYVPETLKTSEMCRTAVSHHPLLMSYVPNEFKEEVLRRTPV